MVLLFVLVKFQYSYMISGASHSDIFIVSTIKEVYHNKTVAIDIHNTYKNNKKMNIPTNEKLFHKFCTYYSFLNEKAFHDIFLL